MNEYRPMGGRLKFALLVTWIYLCLSAANAVLSLAEYWAVSGLANQSVSFGTYEAIFNISTVVVFTFLAVLVLSIVSNSMWVFRANWNTRSILGSNETQSPWMTTLGHAIPIANLWLPFKGFRQMLNVADSSAANIDRPALGWLNLLWAFWAIGNVVDRISARFVMNDSSYESGLLISAVGSALFVVAAFLFIRYMRTVTSGLDAQSHGNAKVFE